jgi:hypothetical protein
MMFLGMALFQTCQIGVDLFYNINYIKSKLVRNKVGLEGPEFVL